MSEPIAPGTFVSLTYTVGVSIKTYALGKISTLPLTSGTFPYDVQVSEDEDSAIPATREELTVLEDQGAAQAMWELAYE